MLPHDIFVRETLTKSHAFKITHTVKPRPEAHMDMILFKVSLENIRLIPQDQIVECHYI